MTSAPSYVIKVNDLTLPFDVSTLVEAVEYESSDGIADMAKIHIANPDFIVSRSRIFLPGNEVSIWMGYHGDMQHVGRVKIYGYEPTYPEGDAMPRIEATGYTRDRDLMSNEPSKVKKIKASPNAGKAAKKATTKMNQKLKASEGRVFKNMRFSDAVRLKARDYGMREDIDPTPEDPRHTFQKAGMTDYQFVQAVANYTGFVFWVDGDENGRWTLHFKDPAKLTTQSKVFRYVYNDANATLKAFNPAMKFVGVVTKIAVEAKDPKTGKLRNLDFEINPSTDEDPFFTGDLNAQTPKLSGPPSDIVLSIGDVQVRTVANKRFQNDKELALWARAWFRKNAENFVFGEGKLIGDPSLRARQTHYLDGLEDMLSGYYYFSRVRHIATASGGYTCSIDARRVIKGLT